MNKILSPDWKEAFSLDKRRAPEFYQSDDELHDGPHVEAIEFALKELDLTAVFCIEGVPTIAFLVDPKASIGQIDSIHRVLWNQGLLTLLVVIRDDDISAYSLVRKPFARDSSVSNDPRLVEALSLTSDAMELRELIESAESGRYWYEHDDFFDPGQRVDSVLLANLSQAFREIKDDLGVDGAQALLMQAMFIAYLEDREIIGADVFRRASQGGYSAFAELLEAGDSAAFENLFEWLQEAFNGNVFNAPCAFDLSGVTPPKVNDCHLGVLARFRHGREEMVSHQLRFWGYNFKYIPIALISAVYDRFLKEEAEKKTADGAFYTPMFLADMVVSQVWDELTDDQRSKGTFFDPACGSGIFLVRLFQRLVGYERRAKSSHHIAWEELIAIAERLHGGDINASAVRVAAFSLYIALLENTDPRDLPGLIERGHLLPSLYRRTLQPGADFFKTPDTGGYDAVIGNPPWKGRAGQETTAQGWSRSLALPIPAKDIAWGFVWKSLKAVKPSGIVALLLPAMGVLHNTSNEALNARRALLCNAKVRRVLNLSDLCFQLFDGAQRPTALLLYRPREGDERAPYKFEYWTPKADLNLRLKRILSLARSDRMMLRSDHVATDPTLFKRRLWTRSPDERLLESLRTLPTLGSLVRQFKDLRGKSFDHASSWIIGQGFKPAQANRLGDLDYQTTVAEVVTQHPYFAAAAFQPIALPMIESESWPDNIVHRAGFSEGFLGPHILIPQGVERSSGRVRAAYTEQSLVFEHSLQAIAFPPTERANAKLLTAVLNSRLAAWFYFHETANLGTERAKVVQADLLKLPFCKPVEMPNREKAELAASKIVAAIDKAAASANELLRRVDDEMTEIDQLVYQYYDLDEQDIALVEDCFDYIIPAMQPRRSAGMQKIWQNSDSSHRKAYSGMLCNALKVWIKKPLRATLIARSGGIGILKLALKDGADRSVYMEESAAVGPELDRLSRNLKLPLPGNVQVIPDLRLVVGNEMYLVKPLQLRYWLRSSALADAAQIAAELQSQLVSVSSREDMHVDG